MTGKKDLIIFRHRVFSLKGLRFFNALYLIALINYIRVPSIMQLLFPLYYTKWLQKYLEEEIGNRK
jgi:hypothetical protein